MTPTGEQPVGRPRTSWRKYIEHVGLTGSTVNGSTRSIITEGPLGKFVALSLLHEPFHGVHHWRSGIPHAELPLFVSALEPKNPDEVAPFPSYWHAFKLDLLRRSRLLILASWILCEARLCIWISGLHGACRAGSPFPGCALCRAAIRPVG